MDCSLPGSSVHGIFQVRRLEQVVISSSRGCSWTKDQTCVSCINRQFLYWWATLEAPLGILGESIFLLIWEVGWKKKRKTSWRRRKAKELSGWRKVTKDSLVVQGSWELDVLILSEWSLGRKRNRTHLHESGKLEIILYCWRMCFISVLKYKIKIELMWLPVL